MPSSLDSHKRKFFKFFSLLLTFSRFLILFTRVWQIFEFVRIFSDTNTCFYHNYTIFSSDIYLIQIYSNDCLYQFYGRKYFNKVNVSICVGEATSIKTYQLMTNDHRIILWTRIYDELNLADKSSVVVRRKMLQQKKCLITNIIAFKHFMRQICGKAKALKESVFLNVFVLNIDIILLQFCDNAEIMRWSLVRGCCNLLQRLIVPLYRLSKTARIKLKIRHYIMKQHSCDNHWGTLIRLVWRALVCNLCVICV